MAVIYSVLVPDAVERKTEERVEVCGEGGFPIKGVPDRPY